MLPEDFTSVLQSKVNDTATNFCFLHLTVTCKVNLIYEPEYVRPCVCNLAE
jgi:hypothetical protein